MTFAIEFDREDDGRWIAEIGELPGVMVYGATQLEAKFRVEALALRVLAIKSSTGRSRPAPTKAAATHKIEPGRIPG